MSADLVGLGFAVHGVLCTGAVLAIWKLHGDSKFGQQPQKEMRELRGRVLRSISQSLVDTFEPILMLGTSVEISPIIVPGSSSEPAEPKITTTGKETLVNAVRDFVKSDVEMLKSLRSLDVSDVRITHSLIWLRRLTFALAVISGIFLSFAALAQFEVWATQAGWLHIMGFGISGVVLCATIAFMWRISHSVNVFETLKEKHADLF